MAKNPKYATAANIRCEVDINAATLRNWAIAGKLEFIQTPSGKRLYHREQAMQLVGVKSSNIIVKRRLAYARVSSHHQQKDLERQIEYLQQECPDYEIVSDIASGLNWKRRGFLSILDNAHNELVQEVVVTHRDRLCRFGFELIEWLFEKYKVKLVVLSALSEKQGETSGSCESTGAYNELAEDLLAVTNFFVARNNGLRSAHNRRCRNNDSRNAHNQIEAKSGAENDSECLDGSV
jgi:predicted site-specific integrase-resolvase